MSAWGKCEGKDMKPIGTSAVQVLAKVAAKRAVREHLREQGIRVSLVKPAEIVALAQAYLANHPELYRDALHRALQMKLPMRGGIYWGELEEAIYELVRSKWPSVLQTDGIEKSQMLSRAGKFPIA
jgi:hypothetical protein